MDNTKINIPLKEYINLLEIAFTTETYLELNLETTKDRLKDKLNEFKQLNNI